MGAEDRALLLQHFDILPTSLRVQPNIVGGMGGSQYRIAGRHEAMDWYALLLSSVQHVY